MTAKKFTVTFELPNVRQGDAPLPLSEIGSYKILYQNSGGTWALGVEVSGPFTQREQTSPPVQPDHSGAVNYRVVAIDTLGQSGLARESGLNVPELPPPPPPPDAPNILHADVV